MKKTVRLTESELINVIQRIVKESQSEHTMDEQSQLVKTLMDKFKQYGSDKLDSYFKNMTADKAKKFGEELRNMDPKNTGKMKDMMLTHFKGMADKKIDDFFKNMTPEKAKQLEADVNKMTPEQRTKFRKMMFDRLKKRMGQGM